MTDGINPKKLGDTTTLPIDPEPTDNPAMKSAPVDKTAIHPTDQVPL